MNFRKFTVANTENEMKNTLYSIQEVFGKMYDVLIIVVSTLPEKFVHPRVSRLPGGLKSWKVFSLMWFH